MLSGPPFEFARSMSFVAALFRSPHSIPQILRIPSSVDRP